MIFTHLKKIAKISPNPIYNTLLDIAIRRSANLIPISEFSEKDIFIVGFPKSGNTWFQNLVTGIIYGMDPEYAPDALVQDLVPDVHYKRYYRRYQTPMFFKSHRLPMPDYRRVVYLLRDGRDAMVSYFHYYSALQNKNIDFLEMIQKIAGLECKWHEHVEAWLSNPYRASTILIKYEDLLTNPVGELKRFCEFVGVDRNESFLEMVARKSSFEKMRQKEILQGWDHPSWPKDELFVRRGIVGSYKDEMPHDVLNIFVQEAGATLAKCGYE